MMYLLKEIPSDVKLHLWSKAYRNISLMSQKVPIDHTSILELKIDHKNNVHTD